MIDEIEQDKLYEQNQNNNSIQKEGLEREFNYRLSQMGLLSDQNNNVFAHNLEEGKYRGTNL